MSVLSCCYFLVCCFEGCARVFVEDEFSNFVFFVVS